MRVITLRLTHGSGILTSDQRDGDFLKVAVFLGVDSVRTFHISAPSGLIHHKIGCASENGPNTQCTKFLTKLTTRG